MIERKERAKIGQFFTDRKTAEYMAGNIICHEEMDILDMGAGTGILSFELAGKIAKSDQVQSVCMTFAENDPSILNDLQKTIREISAIFDKHGVRFAYHVVTENYLLYEDPKQYDIVIANPPYKKIRKNAEEARYLQEFVSGQPNLYSLFMAKGIQQLKNGGQVEYITPRSWTNGNYFSNVRRFLFQNIDIRKILLFSNRGKSFATDEILQETMITYGMKKQQQKTIRLDIASDCSFEQMSSEELDASMLISNGILRLPETDRQRQALSSLSGYKTFDQAGYKFMTGPVVEFRTRQYVSVEKKEDSVSMYRGINIQPDGTIVFPIRSVKNQYLSISDKKDLLPNRNTVFVRRLSPKESQQRIVAASYIHHGKEKYISAENHVNYLVRKDGKEMSAAEVRWIAGMLASEVYNDYFRATGGSTQVNASDLNSMPVKGEKEVKQKISKYNYNCLNDAKAILTEIGMPETLCNPRCVMTFCACAEMNTSNWKKISEDYHGTHDIIAFVNTCFPNKAGLDDRGYQENSRETIRDCTLKPWVDAAIMEAKPGIATNDKNNGYRFTAEFAALVRKYGTEEWEDALHAYRETHDAYKTRLKQIKAIDKGYPVTYAGTTFHLKSSKHNKLQKLILDEFAPRFASGAKLLYIGDATDRTLTIDKKEMERLGIHVFDDISVLPDIVLYDEKNDRILFVEAYSSTGEFTLERVRKILSLCKTDSEIAFVTAFEKTRKMLSVYPKIAWDTDIWVAEDATHMTHKNGDKFLGRKYSDA